MPGIRKEKLKCGSYQGWYIDFEGKTKFFKGTSSKSETLQIATKIEIKHRELRLLGQSPNHSNKNIQDIIKEYFSWGKSHGGKQGFAWSKKTEHDKTYRLNWWIDKLKITTIGQLESNHLLFDCEKALTEFKEGHTNKTIHLHIEALKSFINWCINNNFLKECRIKNITKFPKKPQTKRRALTINEFKKLIDVAPIHRKILYELAVLTGLRRGEITQLKISDLTSKALIIPANIAKNRIETIQPLPENFIIKLLEVRKYLSKVYDLGDRLFFIGVHPERMLKKDCKKADIEVLTQEGKIDFHSLRVTFITWLSQQHVTLKDLQELARHSDVNLTLSTYAKVSEERKQDLVESLFRVCLSN